MTTTGLQQGRSYTVRMSQSGYCNLEFVAVATTLCFRRKNGEFLSIAPATVSEIVDEATQRTTLWK